jgi:hypothetical protein
MTQCPPALTATSTRSYFLLRRWTRVFFSSLRCFFLAMRLRRFLMTEPTKPSLDGRQETGDQHPWRAQPEAQGYRRQYARRSRAGDPRAVGGQPASM